VEAVMAAQHQEVVAHHMELDKNLVGKVVRFNG
jgi:hypothetical protein